MKIILYSTKKNITVRCAGVLDAIPFIISGWRFVYAYNKNYLEQVKESVKSL